MSSVACSSAGFAGAIRFWGEAGRSVGREARDASPGESEGALPLA